MDTRRRLVQAIQSYWQTRDESVAKQKARGSLDTGARSAVTGGAQMNKIERLIADILCDAGLKRIDVKTRSALELPGYYRAEKRWDLIVVSEGQFVLAMELKSQVGPSFGNNFNNRSEEALGSATCLWTAFREGRFGSSPRPFLGYLFLLEDCPQVKSPVRNREPYFEVDAAFRGNLLQKGQKSWHAGVSYSQRYELLIRRMVRENIYTAAAFIMATRSRPTRVTEPAEDLSFQRFEAALRGHALTFLQSQRRA